MRMLHAVYHITPGTPEGKRSPRTECEGGGAGRPFSPAHHELSWFTAQARCGMPRSCPSPRSISRGEGRAARSNTLRGGREGWHGEGRGGEGGGRVQLKHQPLQLGLEADVDGLIVRLHILANIVLQVPQFW